MFIFGKTFCWGGFRALRDFQKIRVSHQCSFIKFLWFTWFKGAVKMTLCNRSKLVCYTHSRSYNSDELWQYWHNQNCFLSPAHRWWQKHFKKRSPNISTKKEIQQKHSEQNIEKVWKALPKKLHVSCCTESQLRTTGQRRRGGSSGWMGRTSQPGPATLSEEQDRLGGSWGAAGAAPALGIRHLHEDRERMKPVWDIGLQVSYRNHSETQPGMAMFGV